MTRSKFERELAKLFAAMDHVESGKADHMFVDAETKAALLADLKVEIEALVKAELDANPGLYKQNPDGTYSLVPDSEREVIPLRRAK